MELDTNPAKIRSTLIYLSVSIILWDVAGGSFNADLGLLGGSIHFQHIEYLEYTGVAIFLYLLWRYKLVLMVNFYEFQTNVMLALPTDRKFLEFARKIIMSSNRQLESACNDRLDYSWIGPLMDYYRRGLKETRSPIPPTFNKFLFPTSLLFVPENTAQYGNLINHYRISQDANNYHSLHGKERIMAQWLVAKAVVRTTRNSQIFYEIVFPMILATIAYLTLGWNLISLISRELAWQ